ncbi:MAG: thrombospondin type 3 repeat-containing protein [Bacteriovorax sp.]|nr:thrombospondin type 3 repeat-containing protein [Bacteriovorax sp.]
MLLKNFLTWALLCLFTTIAASCSFKSDQKLQKSLSSETNELKADPAADSDGDGVRDSVEVENGSDPLVADVPILESNFFQNFTINVGYNKVNDNNPLTFSISTKIKDTDPTFKYRVGKLFGVDNSMYYAAKEGRFSGHSYGIIKNEDFYWVKYPTLDPLMLHSDIIKFRPILDSEDPVTNSKFENYSVNITLDSTVKLTGVRFKEIKDLSVCFYYHDFEKDSYVLLKNVLINRTFQRNVNESFSVEIDNVPVSFLRDSYFKHGEFLISEVDNYFIPELDKDFKTLMASVKSKTVPVLLTTPSEDTVYYVATGTSGISFLEVLNRIFVKNYDVENNNLKRIGQYENNLGSFEYLVDVKDKDKLGKWFVLTNKFKEHFMDHLYRADDHITLSYITGKNLATQPVGVQASYAPKVSTEIYNETVTPLGLVSPNSKIEIQLKGINRFGHEVVATPFSGTYHFGGGGNSTALDYSCAWVGNKRIEFSRDFDLTINYNEEWDKIFLVINEERFKLSTLISEKKVIVRNLNFSFQVSIDDISKIKAIKQSDENNISLAILSFLEKKHQGIKLISQSGNRNSPWCSYSYPGALSTIVLANGQYGGGISKGSIDSSDIEKQIQYFPRDASISTLKLMDDIDYEQNYSLAISTKIINYYN